MKIFELQEKIKLNVIVFSRRGFDLFNDSTCDLCFQLRGPSLTTKHSPANSSQLNRPCLPSVHQLLQPIPAHDSYSSALSVCCLHIVAAGLKIIVHVWKKHSWQYNFVVRVWCLFLDITTCSMFLLLRFLDQYVLNRSGFQRSQLFQLIF